MCMKITEEIWNKKVTELADFKSDSWSMDYVNTDRSMNYYKTIFRAITGKEVFISVPKFIVHVKKGSENDQLVKSRLRSLEFFNSPDFLGNYGLTTAFSCIIGEANVEEDLSIETNESEDDYDFNDDIEEMPSFLYTLATSTVELRPRFSKYITKPSVLFGDDLMLILAISSRGFIPTQILFTKDSADTLARMFNDYKKFMGEFLENKKNKDVETYKIKLNTRQFNQLKFKEVELKVDYKTDPEKCYNSDLPMTEINNFIKSKDSGICIFYGQPGCGKSSFIKYLAQTNPKVSFNITSQGVLQNIDEFRGHLINKDLSNGDTIYVVEDCEKLLVSREISKGGDNVLAEILNLSDGILGDYLKVKFIFTFNTDIPKIDQALLRKGRLRVKHEFKPLTGDKLKNLAKELGIEVSEEEVKKGIPLSDIYHKSETVDFDKKEKRRIGF